MIREQLIELIEGKTGMCADWSSVSTDNLQCLWDFIF